jgi:bacterioferritin-associated ferredoxin/formylmethanofuran dehydrogenase subunit D
LILTTGRVLAQYQSGTQTRRIPELQEIAPEPFAEIHPAVAEQLGVTDGGEIVLATRRGSTRLPARLSPEIREDTVFVPFHWGGEQSINQLTNPALDPISRMPEFKVCAVSLKPALAGTAHVRRPADEAARVCDCNGVTRSRIVEAVLNGARSLQAVCDATRAGTGCGTCRVEVQGVIDATCRRLDMPGAPVSMDAKASRSPGSEDPGATSTKAILNGEPRRSLVVIGNGMAGVACVEQILKHAAQFDITIFGDETHVNYNRILLSSVLAGEKASDEITLNPLDWYRQHGIRLRVGVRVTDVDAERKTVTVADGTVTPYDTLLIATGSSAWMPPIAGLDLDGVFAFRTLDDTRALLSRA